MATGGLRPEAEVRTAGHDLPLFRLKEPDKSLGGVRYALSGHRAEFASYVGALRLRGGGEE